MRLLQRFPILWAMCFVVSVVLYAPTLKAFLIWDDIAIIPWISPSGIRGWINCFLPMDTGFVRPAPLLAFKICYEIGGTRPLPYHLLALAVHAAVAALTGLLAGRLFEQWRWAGIISSLMMATHFGAFHVGAQLSNSCDSFAALGILFALFHWDHWLLTASARGLWMVALGWLIGIFGKELAVITPVLMLLWAIGRNRLDRQTARVVLWFGLAAGLIGAAMLWLQVTAQISYVNTGEVEASHEGRMPRFLNLVANTYMPYLSMVQWPVNKVVTSHLLLRISRRVAVVVLAAAIVAILTRGKFRLAGALALCGVVVVLPVVPIRAPIMGRYLYCALPFAILAMLSLIANVRQTTRVVCVVLLVELWAAFLFSFRWSPTPKKYTAAARVWSKFVSSVDKERVYWPPLSTITVYTNFAHGGRKHIPTSYGMAMFRVFFPDMLADYVSNKKLPRTTHVYRFDGHKLTLLQEDEDTSGTILD